MAGQTPVATLRLSAGRVEIRNKNLHVLFSLSLMSRIIAIWQWKTGFAMVDGFPPYFSFMRISSVLYGVPFGLNGWINEW